MTSDLPYRPCVGIMLINSQGRVFAGKRIDQTVEGWQMPQGGIDEGESPREAALRELMEEAGTDKAEIVAELPDWLTYDLPAHLVGVAFHGKFKGQKQKWFLMRFTGQDNDIDLYAHEPEFSDWKWFELDEIPNLIVPFKRPTYDAVIAGFRALVTGKG
jgi:putative (di)nucleoside polyphosphate hydrolase